MSDAGAKSVVGSLEKLRSYHIDTERDGEILRQLNRLLKKDGNGDPIPEPRRFTGNLETQGVAIIEASGGGKTTAVNHVLSNHSALKPRSGEDWPRYFCIQVPSPATLKSLGREVLTATGLTEVSMRLTAWELWRLVRHRLALLGIVVLWFDEAHDMFLSGSAREIEDMLKMLKSLMQNDSAIIPILSGTERLSEITSYDPQVNRRFSKVVPSPLVAGKDNSDLLGLIESFCDVAELKLSRERNLTDRLIFASRQRFGRAVETILDAIECAKEEGSRVRTH
ncbi:TniB family NTP-binding protein [Ruegeria sp. HKCCA0235A]|uniref:TniB family NTP-binding protein n=1 Tax=Ruegeria sp. HKCCA0235A TaxID=2682998 RepID=UPI0014886B56|nr:TniB family NTP-binding protein [Ruegeria sp. HKCCA0235A]